MAEELRIRTERLEVRPARPDGRDVACLLRLWNDPRVLGPVGFPRGLELEEADVRRQITSDGDELLGAVLLVELRDGEFVGQARLSPLDADGVSESDLKLLPEHQGHGLALELKRALLEFAFRHTRCEAVRTTPLRTNTASIALQERVGARVVGQGLWRDGEAKWRPYCCFELRRDEWELLERQPRWLLVRRTKEPLTRRSLVAAFRELGIDSGDLLLVHSSLSGLGYVIGGEVAVVQALLEVLGDEGTLVVPTHTSENTDPEEWGNPPVPRSWWTAIRDDTPGFDPQLSTPQQMGRIAECVCRLGAARRSSHPNASFAAVGPLAAEVCRGPEIHESFGEDSPLARLHDLDADVLLLGCGYDSHTSFHLAEHRAACRSPRRAGGTIGAGAARRFVEWQEIDYQGDEFEELGRDFEGACPVARQRVGLSTARLFRQRDSVDFAVQWLRARHAEDA